MDKYTHNYPEPTSGTEKHENIGISTQQDQRNHALIEYQDVRSNQKYTLTDQTRTDVNWPSTGLLKDSLLLNPKHHSNQPALTRSKILLLKSTHILFIVISTSS